MERVLSPSPKEKWSAVRVFKAFSFAFYLSQKVKEYVMALAYGHLSAKLRLLAEMAGFEYVEI